MSNTSVIHLLNHDRFRASPERAAELKAVQKLLLELHLVRRVKSKPGRDGYYFVQATDYGARICQNRTHIEELLDPAEQRLMTYREILRIVSECNQCQFELLSHSLHNLVSTPYYGTLSKAIQFLLDDGVLRAKGNNLFITKKTHRFQNTSDDRPIKHLESKFFMD